MTAKCRATTGAADTTAISISGWDTDSTHYIKIWTDPAENYRHQGKWDVRKYRLEISTNNDGVDISTSNVYVYGLQILLKTSNTSTAYHGIDLSTSGAVYVADNIVQGSLSGATLKYGIGRYFYSTGGTFYIWNNIVYGFSGQSNNLAGIIFNGDSSRTVYAYNNTSSSNYYGFYRVSSANFISKNNIAYNNIDNYSGTFAAGSTNNLSGPSSDSDIAGQTAPQNGVTVTFADEYNNDFHLDSSDTGAKNHGTILYDSGDDSNLNFTTDADNEARKDSAGTWDIGADENVAKIYRSVGVGATSPLASGGTADSSYGNMEIKPTYLNVGSTANLTDYIATFWRPLPDNVGVGDAIQYDQDNTGGIDKIVFITKRIDSTHYSVRKSDGTAPDATTSMPNSGWGIYRSYISLSNAEAGTENTGITAGVRDFDTGDVNLTTNNLQWNITCYANGTAADGIVTISGWTTAVDNYIKIYTPTRTDEVGSTQRHSGKWSTSAYRIESGSSDSGTAINANVDNVHIDGLQVYMTRTSGSDKGIYLSSNNGKVSNNIVRGNFNSSVSNSYGILIGGSSGKVYNNIVYDWSGSSSALVGIYMNSSGAGYAYNNTIVNCYAGIMDGGGSGTVAKNNIVKGGGSLAYNGTFASGTDYNSTDGTDNIGTGSNNKISQTFSFADETNDDFHLAPGDAGARNSGADLTNDLYLPLNTDIDSTGSIDGKSCDAVYQDQCLTRPRSTSWDIGADELITKIYRSVGVGTTAAIISGTSSSISLTISGNTGTFSTFPTSADFGVGDVIRYDSDNNGSLDSTAFVSAIDSTAKTATLQNSTGGTAPQMAVADFDWKLYRAYTSLSNWESGTENTGVGVTYDAGNRDIATNSEQWNVACYSPTGGTAPDTTSISISGWTTKPQNYIKVYTPTLSSEVTTSQRHQGKWDGNKYIIQGTFASGGAMIDIIIPFVKVEGLQVYIIDSTNGTGPSGIRAIAGAGDIYISSNIVKASLSNGAYGAGIGGHSTNNATTYIYNNVVYDFIDGSTSGCVGIYSYGVSSIYSYVYNNTVYNNRSGILVGAGKAVMKNNIANNSSNVDYGGSFESSDYNIASDATAPGSHSKNSTTVSFVDATNKDFHLLSTDTAAKDAGADLSQDLYLPITNDVDGQLRPINGTGFSTDIGADEGATAIYRSLAPNATGSIASGTSPANSMIIAGTSVTFGTAPGDTIGVGDAIQYDSDNNGSVDSVAFITYRTDSTHYTIQDRTGGTPTSTSATDYDWAIYRAYTSLQNASGSSTGGTENTGLSDNIEHFDIDWAAFHGKNIYTNNQQWNIAAYANSTTADTTQTTISGWTIRPTNYVRVYTPTATTEVGTSQRHQGKWDDSKYNLSFNAAGAILYIKIDYFQMDGLQMDNIRNGGDSATTAVMSYNTGSILSNNIIRKTNANNASYAYGIMLSYSGKIYNNIIYGYRINIGTETAADNQTFVFYNNTLYGAENTNLSAYHYYRYYTTFYLKNNLAIGGTGVGFSAPTAYNTTINSSNNISSDATSPDSGSTDCGGHSCRSQAVQFADSANYNFHLGIGDTAARNSGADLSADAYLPITTDIDGHTRPTGTNVVDIGADEGATAIYYSVGQSTSTDFKVSSNITVTGYTATFTTAQTGNIGVGDIVTYDGGSCYITGKTSTSIWSCQNVTGGTAPQVSGVSVTSIKRAFASLNSSISGSTAPTFLNTSDLKTNNYILNIPCYMDSGTTPDTTAVTIQGYTTAVPNYIKVYTPNNTTTEANQSQRHQGKWDDGKYNITISSNNNVMNISSSDVIIDGLQIKTSTGSYNSLHGIAIQGISAANPVKNAKVSNNIIVNGNINQTSRTGIYFMSAVAAPVYVYSNIVYDFTNTSGVGIDIYNDYGVNPSYAYNNTVINSTTGFVQNNRVRFKNNVTQNCTDGYYGGFLGGSDYNISDVADDTTGISTSYRSGLATTVTFQDYTNKNFHLGIGGTAAQNVGTDLSADTGFAFTTDIDGNTRNIDSRGWDIGADESATAIYYSVGQSSSDLKTGSPTLSIDSSGNGTLSVSQTGNMGVGDYIEYGTSPYNKAYITGKTSSTVWTVQAANGTMLGVATTEPVNSIKHSYTTLSGAIAGASGATMMNTTDLYANNYQLNIPCYYDNAADTTATTISGYTTYSMNYIKVYTPTNISTEANNSQRHQGKWDDGKYRLESAGQTLAVYANYTKINGLQIKLTSAEGSHSGIYISVEQGRNAYVNNNIIKGVGGGYGILQYSSNLGVGYIYNNIIYNFVRGLYSNNAYVNNNTLINNSLGGICCNNWQIIVKNNIVQGSQDGYVVSNSSDYNISDIAGDSPGSHSRNGVTVNFVDSANYDFHLAENDTSARNAGADLSTDTNLAVTTDIDGNSRPTQNVFDIGADEGSTYIYYSVGQNTNDHKTGSPTITLSGYQATLSIGQTAPNMGVGDLITYTGGSCYITKKTNDDKMHWNCQNATGGTAPQVTGVSVTSIAHAFSSLNGAINTDGGNGAHDSSHLNTDNLYSGNYILNIPCYYDSGPDTAAARTGSGGTGWTTYMSNYLKMYAPNDIVNEVNQSQRHSGKWDDSKYRIEYTLSGAGSILGIYYTNHARAEGIQLKVSNSSAESTYGIAVSVNNKSSDIQISNNIIRGGAFQSGSYNLYGINGTGISSASNRQYIWNNLVYDFNNGTTGYGIYNSADTGYTKTQYIYNNTIYNCYYGIRSASNSNIVAKNNVVQGATDGYYGSFASGSDYNISNVSSDTTGGAHDKDNTTVTFADLANKDFHLSPADASARNAGDDLSDDANLYFTNDIEGTLRDEHWDIGADEFKAPAATMQGNFQMQGKFEMR